MATQFFNCLCRFLIAVCDLFHIYIIVDAISDIAILLQTIVNAISDIAILLQKIVNAISDIAILLQTIVDAISDIAISLPKMVFCTKLWRSIS